MEIAVLGIDIGKNVCSVVELDDTGAVVLRRRVRRDTLVALVGKLPACIVAMEACCGAHHLGRLFAAEGHDVRLGCVDGFDQDEAESKRDERAVILRRLLASKCDTLEAFELADSLFERVPVPCRVFSERRRAHPWCWIDTGLPDIFALREASRFDLES